jgi:hypothetical protein
VSTTDWGTPPPQQEDPAWGNPPPDAKQQAGLAAGTGVRPPSLDDALEGTSVRSFSFDADSPGVTADGLIVEIPPAKQQIDYDSKQPKTWNDGSPMWTYPVHIQTNMHEDDEDDGIRALYFSYKKLEALKAAQKAAGVKVQVGGRLMLRWVSGGPKERGPNATKFKVFAAKYFPPGSPEARQLAGQPQQAVQAAPAPYDDTPPF